jgi:hypothetical protein
MTTRTVTLMNCDRAEYGVITVDLDLLGNQIAWLESLPGLNTCVPECQEWEGLLNLLGGIMDLADPLENEEE